ncbi:MAG TPA: hypothetical protein VKP64_15570 [Mycobacteriales bacterium]|nr:hypothetical protein [Mycobacteriales bacterium]
MALQSRIGDRPQLKQGLNGDIMKLLSESLAELAAKAKAAEDAVATAREERREQLEARLARSCVRRRNRRSNKSSRQHPKPRGARRCAGMSSALRSSVNAQLERINSDVEARQQARDVQGTQRRAEWAEQDAAAAIAFASFAIEQAEDAVLDATLARYEADAADRT